MYQYDDYDKSLIMERVNQFADQVDRRLSGELSEEEFLPLRLQNGLYLQKHAYMLRVAIPYGTLSSVQLHTLANIADEFDRGYGHFTTRQNIQFNWVELERTPSILARLAEVDMHAIQTSGNCIRNVTTEAFAGVSADEAVDPRPTAEILRQWSTINPEFLFLPRKFKIAVSSTQQDRAAVRIHDIGLYLYKETGSDELLVKVMVGGGLGRTPIISQVLKQDLSWKYLLSYLESVLRVYNRHGRRDNKYKARIKILVKTLGIDAFAEEVENEWKQTKSSLTELTVEEYIRVSSGFIEHDLVDNNTADYQQKLAENTDFSKWVQRNTQQHKHNHYLSILISTKAGPNNPPGDMSSSQMHHVADLADKYCFGEIRVTHEQNLVLPEVRKDKVFDLWLKLKQQKLATPTIGLLTDMITCPGGDFCALANTKSISVAAAIQRKFDDLDYLYDLGTLSLNISGCMNACSHHHIGNIGILGVDKNGTEFYQVTLGGKQGTEAQIGKVIGPSFDASAIPDVIDKISKVYLNHREADECFSDTFSRIGMAPFKQGVYDKKEATA